MKSIAGTLRLDLAQFRELEAFAKFGSDLDAATTAVLEKGKRNVEILKQGLNRPMKVEEQIVIIYCGVQGLLNEIDVDKVSKCEEELIRLMNADFSDTLIELKKGNLTEKETEAIQDALKKVLKNYN